MQKYLFNQYKIYLTIIIGFFLFPLQGQEVHFVALKELRPTQSVISHLQVTRKLSKYHKSPKKLDKDVNEIPRKTAVIGPNQTYFLTDGHHTFSAMYDYHLAGPDYKVAVEITHDLSNMSDLAFWNWMKNQNLTWLRDKDGKAISHTALPTNLGTKYLQDDPFRGAMFFLRDHFWQKPTPAIPFIEFYWAQYFREVPGLQPPKLVTQVAYMEWLKKIADHMQQIPKHINIGPTGQGPDSLGRLPVDPYTKPVFDFTVTDEDSGLVLAVVEIPTGSNEKWEHHKNNSDLLVWERVGEELRYINYLAYPFNYGSLPGTLSKKELGGDGDPKDVIILGNALPHGALLNVRIIGQLNMLDNGERDNKLIAVLPNTPPFSSLTDLEQLNNEYPGIKEIVRTWFLNYKGKTGSVTELEFAPYDSAHSTNE